MKHKGLLRASALVSVAALAFIPTAAQAEPVMPTTPSDNVVMKEPQDQTQGVGKEVNNYIEAMANMKDVNAAPPGSNDWSCRPTKEHPYPVVLVHGYASMPYTPWAKLSPVLKRAGFCVFSADYGQEKNRSVAGHLPGFHGMDDPYTAAMEIARFVEAVRHKTGAKKVNFVSWSQGGLTVQTYLHFYGGANAANPSQNKVANFVSLAGAQHGTTGSGLAKIIEKAHSSGKAEMIDPIVDKVGGKAVISLLPDSALVKANKEAGDTMPGINYTVISSENDMVVTPIENTWMKAGPGATVTNVRLQDGCSKDHSDHHAIVYDPRAIDFTMIGLGVKGITPRCEVTVPMFATGPTIKK